MTRFGGDAHALWLRQELSGEEVDLSASETAPAVGSGQGIVWLDREGGATSVVLGGANTEGWQQDGAALQAEARRLVAGAAALMVRPRYHCNRTAPLAA